MTQIADNASSHSPKRLPQTPLEWASWAAYLADSKKAVNIQVLRTADVTTLADYFVVCSGLSKPQVKAIAEEILYEFKHAGNQPAGNEQDVSQTWCLLDFTDVVVHVMQEEARSFYKLEQFWNHAELLSADSWQAVAADLGLLHFNAPTSE